MAYGSTATEYGQIAQITLLTYLLTYLLVPEFLYAVVIRFGADSRERPSVLLKNSGSRISILRFEADFQKFYNYDIALKYVLNTCVFSDVSVLKYSLGLEMGRPPGLEFRPVWDGSPVRPSIDAV